MWIKRLTIVAFVTPAVVMLVLTRLWPTAEAIYDSLFRQSLIGGTSFGGLANYVTVAKDPVFLKGLTVTAIFGLIVNPFQIVLALVFAVVLSERWRGASFFRTVILFPAGVPSAVAVVIFGIALRPDGPVNGFLHDLGLPSQPFLNSPDQALASIILIVSWIGVGYWVIFLVGGVQDIPTTLYEAAEIDGAGWWKKFLFCNASPPSSTTSFRVGGRHDCECACLCPSADPYPRRSRRLDEPHDVRHLPARLPARGSERCPG